VSEQKEKNHHTIFWGGRRSEKPPPQICAGGKTKGGEGDRLRNEPNSRPKKGPFRGCRYHPTGGPKNLETNGYKNGRKKTLRKSPKDVTPLKEKKPIKKGN